MSAACPVCNDTGSLSKDLYGYIDCTHCGVAKERAKLERWMAKNAENCDDDCVAWIIYQHGKAAALEQAKKAIQDERVDDTGEEGDIAYNSAIDHALSAVDRLKP